MDTVRIGIIGMGGMGASHARYLLDGKVSRARLTAICDIVPERMEPYADLAKFEDSGELIRSGEADAVIIATPHYGHTTIGIDALGQGLHVLTEKPISVHKADCERLIAAHTDDKLKFAAMFQMRTEAPYQKLRQLVQGGALGRLLRTNWIITAWYRTEAYYASGGWRATWKGEGGGVLLNQCPHTLDLYQWICGMPSKVRAECKFGKYHDIEVEDEVNAYFEYPDGATGQFCTSTAEAPGTNRLEIAGEHGKIVFEGGKIAFTRNEMSCIEHCQNSPQRFERPDVWNIEIPVRPKPNGHAVVTQNFVNAILDDEPLLSPAEEGIHSVELANAMLFSAFENRDVELPLDGEAYERKLKDLIANSRFQKKTSGDTDLDLSGSTI
jgi:predicted dehydrogenase